jgi:hypothetical protein
MVCIRSNFKAAKPAMHVFYEKKKKKKRGKNSNHMQAVKLIIKEILDKVFV